ncbi:bifunctional phosphopantothenoylcysteine decarboxylase/phosphopantothenate--cysteine ligase CoaBC [Methanoplanus sp. FWC-SCC4]|uniref:Coenzyme A biosynthesis bifunctional protein CoaBC n=1 Tax=Methanochimaera problematica TaxID=2609417 RepID=A0AA97FDL8_9EURY|nr:bifunctional phosphopantothenoylcysteine decarboxylase/phosphopantothenate--cysteine ligase CoaBC [Methanoplanus sp. FWC-SCC4]WOF16323.1 bifunctional phosphopantothenoylcysteine decarboxylase/phosphopantothenate--cysteine ligase CoaBC [Methanoplanus sp. FWC-SCC4]
MNAKVLTLKEKVVVLGITGSIAAVEDIKLARSLRRKGAIVQGVMSDAACGIIHPDSVTYACDRETITKISGMIEHVKYCGIGGCADILLIAPATANTICKIAAGIDDTPVTTFATTAIGRGMPVVIVPAMHESMYRHPAVTDSIEKLKSWGIVFSDPNISENKAKIASSQEIILTVERSVMGRPLEGKKVLITGGACRERIDDVRVMTTRASGRMGREIALFGYRLGADVTIIHNGDEIPFVENVYAESADDMRKAVHDLLSGRDYDYYISSAAISDYKPEYYEGKIPSGAEISLGLLKLPKLISEVLSKYDVKTVAFKLGWDESQKALNMIDSGVDMVLVNTPDSMGGATGNYTILKKGWSREISGDKEEVAAAIWEELL